MDIIVYDYDFLTLGSRQEMSMIKLITTVSLVVALITMIASNQPSIYAYATTEDDGWVEGDDDSQGEISSQEELEDACEGSQWAVKELTQEEQQEWNKSCGDAGEQAGESGQAFSKETYQHCGDEATGDNEYFKRFIAGCMKQDDMDEEDCNAETDRLSVWGDKPL